jgi:hypothetical protein
MEMGDVVLEQKAPEMEIVKQMAKDYEQFSALEKAMIIEYGPNRVEMRNLSRASFDASATSCALFLIN